VESAETGYGSYLPTTKGPAMPIGDIETYHEDGQWKNKIEGQEGDVGMYDDRHAAIHEGRNLARVRQVEHIIRRADGTIGERNSYGHDPRDIKG
jgi:hypothetical protein